MSTRMGAFYYAQIRRRIKNRLEVKKDWGYGSIGGDDRGSKD